MIGIMLVSASCDVVINNGGESSTQSSQNNSNTESKPSQSVSSETPSEGESEGVTSDATTESYDDAIDSSTDDSKDETTDTSKDETTDTSKDETTDTSKDETTDTSKDETTDTSVDNSTEETTDSSQPGEDNPDIMEVIKYVVKVTDVFGETPSALITVEVYKDWELVAETALRKGTAAFRLEPGEYTFEIKSEDCEFYYDADSCVLTAEEPEMTVVLYEYADETNTQEIFVYDEAAMDHKPYNAVQVNEGATYVTIDRPENSYFIFTPTRGGIYKISYESDKNLTIGYYGSPHNVLTACPLEVVDGAFELEIKNEGVQIGAQGGTTQVVIGIRSFTVKGCVLKIERIGNATVELPWTEVQADKNAVKVDNYINSEFVDFDVTNSELSVVFNENDGYYHLNSVDGPVIYIRISSAVIESTTETETIYKYLPSFVHMCGTGTMGKVFYDDDGTIVLKERYNELFYQYAELCGAGGMYPLNKQLAEVIQNLCDHNGWTDLDGQNQIFGDNATLVFEENAWLFACAYEQQFAKGTEGTPAPVTPTSKDESCVNAVLLENGTLVVLRTVKKATITINNGQGVKVVANDGTEYVADAETGVLSAVINANQNFTIVYEGEEEQTVVHFTFVEYIA